MTTETIIEYLRGSWWIVLFCIAMTTYFIYTFIRDHIRIKEVRERKVELEKERAALEAEYEVKAKKLEEKLNERKNIFRGGRS